MRSSVHSDPARPDPARPDPARPDPGRSRWREQTGGLRRALREAVSTEELRRLHRRRPALHFLVLGWQFLLLFGAGAVAFRTESAGLWLPASVVVGLTVFNFTVMLHEVVHDTVFRSRRPLATRVLRHLYAFPSGISATQFSRWHLDHHAQLGDSEADPKRHWLSPKRNARWYKALYLTPALIPIYFRAARAESAAYPENVRQVIRRERRLTVLGHFAILALLVAAGGPLAALRTYLIPVFLVFPVAFTLNRLGQHYDIVPENPALWGSVLRPSRFRDAAFLWSAYHLEHHYFPAVPFYNLRALHFCLRPFFARIGARETTYARLVWQWFGQNRAPHTDWGAAVKRRAAPLAGGP